MFNEPDFMQPFRMISSKWLGTLFISGPPRYDTNRSEHFAEVDGSVAPPFFFTMAFLYNPVRFRLIPFSF